MLHIDPLLKPPNVSLSLPGSKSITNRALITAALAKGNSVLNGVLFSEDTFAMVDSLRKLGVEIVADSGSATITVKGSGGELEIPTEPLWVNQSGTTARFCLPLAALARSEVVIDGDEQIKTRPHKDLFLALNSLGVDINYLSTPYTFPVCINGQDFSGGRVEVNGEVSSQFISALLLAAPLLSEKLELIIGGELVSRPYVDMTLAVMEAFGVEVERQCEQEYSVSPGSYKAVKYRIEPDASTASYFFAAAAVSGGKVTVDGLGSGSIQGDTQFVDLLEEMGSKVEKTDEFITVTGGESLSGIDVSMAAFSDTVPTLAAIAPYATSPVSIRDISFISRKESDRVAALHVELSKVGIHVERTKTGLEIYPGEPNAGVIQTYDDHRIAMAFSIMGLFALGTALDSHHCVAKTFPGFFDALDKIRAKGDASLRILAIDGPAGSGKSTLAKHIAIQLGLDYLDTGAMYRSVAAIALSIEVDPGDEERVTAIAETINISFEDDRVYVDGKDLSEEIRSPEVNAAVSQVAANTGVRSAMRRQQRTWARERGGGVLEGRDIGSIVFPDARLKVYVTATPEERARRRSLETGRTVEDIMKEILERDTKDSTRGDSPLVADDEAVVIDTTGKTIEETADYIQRLFL